MFARVMRWSSFWLDDMLAPARVGNSRIVESQRRAILIWFIADVKFLFGLQGSSDLTGKAVSMRIRSTHSAGDERGKNNRQLAPYRVTGARIVSYQVGYFSICVRHDSIYAACGELSSRPRYAP